MVVGTQPHRLRWFRAFFESDVGLSGAKGAPGFTTWVDRQTVSWLPAADAADSLSDSEPEMDEPQKPAPLDVCALYLHSSFPATCRPVDILRPKLNG